MAPAENSWRRRKLTRRFWRVLVDSNTYRVFECSLSTEAWFYWNDLLKKGEPLGDRWRPMKLRFWEGEGEEKEVERRKPVADFSGTTLMPLASARARAIIEPLVQGQVEFLPCETPVGPYYGLHVRYVDCLDTSRARVKRFSNGRILDVIAYAFHWERLENVHIFRIPELNLSRLFVSDEFKRLVEAHHLTGLLFYPVPMVEESSM